MDRFADLFGCLDDPLAVCGSSLLDAGAIGLILFFVLLLTGILYKRVSELIAAFFQQPANTLFAGAVFAVLILFLFTRMWVPLFAGAILSAVHFWFRGRLSGRMRWLLPGGLVLLYGVSFLGENLWYWYGDRTSKVAIVVPYGRAYGSEPPPDFVRKVYEVVRDGLERTYTPVKGVYVLPDALPDDETFAHTYIRAFQTAAMDELYQASAWRGKPFDVVVTSDFTLATSCKRQRIRLDVVPYLWQRRSGLFGSGGTEHLLPGWKRERHQYFEDELELASLIDSFMLTRFLRENGQIPLRNDEYNSALEALLIRFEHFAGQDAVRRPLSPELSAELANPPLGDVAALHDLLDRLVAFYARSTGPLADDQCREIAARQRETLKQRYR